TEPARPVAALIWTAIIPLGGGAPSAPAGLVASIGEMVSGTADMAAAPTSGRQNRPTARLTPLPILHTPTGLTPARDRACLLPSPVVPGRVAFVPIRYGTQFVGGSEAVSREVAMGLASRGWNVDVLTTRAVNHFTMDNDLPESKTLEDGLTVHRFSTVREWSRC